jgi:hemolysin activation/secretion protein
MKLKHSGVWAVALPRGRSKFALMMTSGKMAAEQARQQRLSQALRENLRRRKMQARGRAQEPQPEPTAAPQAQEAGPETNCTRLSPHSQPD